MGRRMVSDVAQIYQVWKEYAAAVNEGDFERWIALWMDDGVRMPPSDSGPRQVGKEQIRAVMQPSFDAFNSEITINAEEIRILGERAYSYGDFDYTVTPNEGGDTLEFRGNFLTILAKQADGSWKIAIDCSNF